MHPVVREQSLMTQDEPFQQRLHNEAEDCYEARGKPHERYDDCKLVADHVTNEIEKWPVWEILLANELGTLLRYPERLRKVGGSVLGFDQLGGRPLGDQIAGRRLSA